jgi:hypothetical protein
MAPGDRFAAASACFGKINLGPVPPMVGVDGDRLRDRDWCPNVLTTAGKSTSRVGLEESQKRLPIPKDGVRGTTIPARGTACGNATLHVPVCDAELFNNGGSGSSRGGWLTLRVLAAANAKTQ